MRRRFSCGQLTAIALLLLFSVVVLCEPAQSRVITIHGVDGKYPVAIVERVIGAAGGVRKYQILWTEDAFDLAEEAEVDVYYFMSCSTEAISGGHVEIGQEESTVTGGKVLRKTVECGGEAPAWMACAYEQGRIQETFIIISSIYPLLLFYGQQEGVVIVDRLGSDQPTQRYVFSEGVLDFAEIGVALNKGADYRFTLEGQSVVSKARIWSKASDRSVAANRRFLAIPTDVEFGRDCH